MRLIPESGDELDPNLRWGVEMRLRLIEEVVCGTQVSWIDAPGKNKALERIQRAWERSDVRAEEEAFEDYMRAELREWVSQFPERQLFRLLYQRAARRRKQCGTMDSRRTPSRTEGLRVASAMLADIPKVGRLDREWESTAVSLVLASPPPLGVFSVGELPEYIKRAEDSRVYFDAVGRLDEIEEKAKSRGEDIPLPLKKFRPRSFRQGQKRPVRNPLQRGRPLNPAILRRDMQIQFTIEILFRVGIPPWGRDVSGIGIVSEALGIPEGTVERIWKQCLWRQCFVPVMKQHSKAIADRTGPFHTTPQGPESRSG